MIISKCPLRVSLVGGSTDLQSFIDVYGRGSVINFPTNLSTYIFFSESKNDKYRISYSRIETLKNPHKIKNDIGWEAKTLLGIGLEKTIKIYEELL